MKKFILAAMLLVPMKVFAYSSGDAFHFGLSLFQQSVTLDGPNLSSPASTSTQTAYDLKLGYLMSSIYLGAMYTVDGSSSGGVISPTRTGLGATVGYHSNGWVIDLTYFLSATYKQVGSANDSLTGGSGFGLDVGYNFMLSDNFYLGLELSYKSYSYTKYSSGTGAETSVTNNYSGYRPMMNLGLLF